MVRILLLVLFTLSCKAAPAPVERRVPVDVIADCVALRQRLSECPDDAADLMLERRGRTQAPGAAADLSAAAVSRAEVLADLARESGLSPADRLEQCRVATAETPLPSPQDVAHLHRCLNLPCARRIACLRPLMLGPDDGPRQAGRPPQTQTQAPAARQPL
jgi:hypothetical protein